jgi:hypothetical protein
MQIWQCASSQSSLQSLLELKSKREVFNDTLVDKMKNISVEHGLWAKFVCDAIEQNNNGPNTTNIAKKLISLRNTKNVVMRVKVQPKASGKPMSQ